MTLEQLEAALLAHLGRLGRVTAANTRTFAQTYLVPGNRTVVRRLPATN